MKKSTERVRDLEFLYEIGCIRQIPRSWQHFLGPVVANLADHHFRVAWTSMVLAAQEKAEVDQAKMLKMALMHDLAESRTGDANYLQRHYVERNESLGIADIVAGSILENDIHTLWKEYEARECLESKIVKMLIISMLILSYAN